MPKALIAFGANVGDVWQSLRRAKELIAADGQIELIAVAEPLVTAAVSGEVDQANALANYVNTVFLIETQLSAAALFQVTGGIENKLGRQRLRRWGPRTVDLDIILYGDMVIDRSDLQVPHRRMSFRKFVIDPAIEIAADWIDPISGVALKHLSHRLQRSERRILWVTGDIASAQNVFEASLAGIAGENQWSGEIVAGFDEVEDPLDDYRLLVYSGGAVSFAQAARIFGGPWLSLERATPGESETEVRGAIQAMQ